MATYWIDWPTPRDTSCPANAPTCPQPRSTLVLTIIARTDELRERFVTTADRIAMTAAAIPSSPSTGSLNPLALSIQAKIPVSAFALAAGRDAIWAVQASDDETKPGRLVRIDPRSNQPVAEVTMGLVPRSVAADESSVWVVNGLSDCSVVACGDPPRPPQPPRFPEQNSVMRVNPATNRVVAEISVKRPLDIAVGYGGVWLTATGESTEGHMTLVRIDPRTNKIAARIELAASSETGDLSIGGGFVWVVTVPPSTRGPDMLTIHRVDPASNTVTSTNEVPGFPDSTDIAFGHGSVWLGTGGENSASGLARIDPATGRIHARITLPDAAPIGLSSIHAGEGYLWAVGGRGSFWKVDPDTNAPVGDAFILGDEPPVGAGNVITGFGSVWVPVGDGKIWRIAP
jgi:hypothetical protein